MKTWIVLIIIMISKVYAIALHAQNKPHFSFTQISTLDTCGILANRRDSVSCNPAHFHDSSYQEMVFYISSKTDGDSVDNGQKLLFEPIEKETLNDLFERNSFNNWDADTRIEFRTKLFYLSYDPIYANANFFVYNPAFPEIVLNMSSQRRINITSGTKYTIGKNEFHFGAHLYYFERQITQSSFALVDVSSTPVDELIDFEKSHGINADVGFIFKNTQYLWIPIIGFQLKNIGSNEEIDQENVESETVLENLFLYDAYNRFEVGYDFKLKYGSLGIQYAQYISPELDRFYADYQTIALNYSIWDFEIMGATSQFANSIAFKFSSDSNAIGINYGSARALGGFNDRAEEFAGISLEIYL